jgi:hypothetical protein
MWPHDLSRKLAWIHPDQAKARKALGAYSGLNIKVPARVTGNPSAV